MGISLVIKVKETVARTWSDGRIPSDVIDASPRPPRV